jgi:hypothetical protein
MQRQGRPPGCCASPRWRCLAWPSRKRPTARNHPDVSSTRMRSVVPMLSLSSSSTRSARPQLAMPVPRTSCTRPQPGQRPASVAPRMAAPAALPTNPSRPESACSASSCPDQARGGVLVLRAPGAGAGVTRHASGCIQHGTGSGHSEQEDARGRPAAAGQHAAQRPSRGQDAEAGQYVGAAAAMMAAIPPAYRLDRLAAAGRRCSRRGPGPGWRLTDPRVISRVLSGSRCGHARGAAAGRGSR